MATLNLDELNIENIGGGDSGIGYRRRRPGWYKRRGVSLMAQASGENKKIKHIRLAVGRHVGRNRGVL